jgi:hypothetical protein
MKKQLFMISNNLYYNSLKLLALFLFLGLYLYGIQQFYENFENFKIRPMYKPDYLFPTKNLTKICAEKGLKPAFGPTSCFKDGQYDPYANCQCLDKQTGECKLCYPDIKKDKTSSSVIYPGDSYS